LSKSYPYLIVFCSYLHLICSVFLCSYSFLPTFSVGLSKCNFSGGYAQLSILQWGKNPYAGSTAVQSPLLRFSLTSNLPSTSTTEQDPITGAPTSRKLIDSVNFNLSSFPAYFVSLQFLAVQDFNFTLGSAYGKTSTVTSNFSLPVCTLHNGLNYVPCQGCNISSYTNYNVTYSCYDITQLCPSDAIPVSVRRSLLKSRVLKVCVL
jgi:hypothetical protein